MESSEKPPADDEQPDDASRTPPHGDELFDREDAEPGDQGSGEE